MRRKVLAYLLAAAMTLSGTAWPDTMAFAGNASDTTAKDSGEGNAAFVEAPEAKAQIKASEILGNEDYKNITEDVTTYLFCSDTDVQEGTVSVTKDSAYSKEKGMGFSKVEFPTDAAGWDGGGSGKGVYHPREEVKVEGDTSYVTAANGALGISSRVWTEKESSGYGVYTYEDTDTFDIDCTSADYEVTVEFVNPTLEAYTAYVEAEDITRGYEYEKDKDNNSVAVVNAEVPANGTKTVTFNACVYDGQLNLKFLAAGSAATREGAAKQTVYVAKVTVKRKATEEAGAKPTIFLVSDSTVQSYTDYYAPQTGWGEVLCEYFGAENYKQTAQDCENSIRHESQVYATDNIIIENRALGGRSSASFVQEGLLDDVLEDIKPGDYLFIQFGHNDATAVRPNRYVAPEDFGKWMQIYVDGAIQRGATPVFVTPVARYDYLTNEDGSLKTFNSGFAKYGSVMKKIAKEQNIPLIDLTARSIEVCNRYGIEGSKKLFLFVEAGQYTGQYSKKTEDKTHLQVLGATEFARCVAQGILVNDHAAFSEMKSFLAEEKLPPKTPQNVHCTSPSAEDTALQKSVTIAWDAVDGAAGYAVYRLDKGTFAKVAEVTGTSYTDEKDVTTNNSYSYTVAAVNGNGIGEQSDICSTPIVGTLTQNGKERYSDRALTGIDLAGDKGAETLVLATDAQGNEYKSGVYLSWRSFAADFDSDHNLTTTFDVYKGDTQIASGIKVTNLIDPAGSKNDTYRVVGSNDASIGIESKNVKPWEKQYLELNLFAPKDEKMPDGKTCSYSANDMSVGDVDGDGVLELIVKWYPSNAQDNSKTGYTGKTFIDTYKMNTSDGTAELLTRIDMGVNIRSGAHYTQFQVWDFDGDGNAEIAVKTSDGTTTYKSADGTDQNLVKVAHVGKADADALPANEQKTAAQYDYRGSNGVVITGSEYFSIFNLDDGKKTAEEIDYVTARGDVAGNKNLWGDDWGNRSERYLSCVAYLDGENPYAVFCRGYYARTTLTAYYIDKTDGKIKIKWNFDTDKAGSEYRSQGNHAVAVNDVDGDGKDEIIYGSLVVDHDGSALNNTKLGHGDALHISDWMPWHEGLEIMAVHEEGGAKYKVEIHDAATGEILVGYSVKEDTGRGAAADIDPTEEGAEWWSIAKPGYDGKPAWDSRDGAVYSSKSTFENLIQLSENNPPPNFTLFWDGDLLSEIQDHNFIEPVVYIPVGVNILKWDYENGVTKELLYSEEIWSNNGTKGNVGLAADILGDWREEIITRTTDAVNEDGTYVDANNKVRIYMSTIQTDYVVPCLLENLAYREGVAWQNVGYNQPANLDYLLSEDVITSKITAIDSNEKEAKIGFTKANDGKYGHEIVSYNIYRAVADSDGKIGSYEKLADIAVGDLMAAGADDPYDYVYTDTAVDYNMTYSYKIASVVEAEGVIANENAGTKVTRESYLSKAAEVTTPVDIDKVLPITLDPIVQDTPCESVADLLPKTVKVIDKANNEQAAKVTWDVSEVNLAKDGTYPVKAMVQGHTEEITVDLFVTPNAVKSQSVTEINVIQDKTDVAGLLPSKMTLTFLNGVEDDVTISWNQDDIEKIDTSKVGESYTVTGTWRNDDIHIADKTITIKANIVTNFIVSLEDISVEVEVGAANIAELLPETVAATYENGDKKAVPITWTKEDIAKIDTSIPGTYEVGYANADFAGSKTAQVIVLYPTVYKFDFGISSSKTEEGWIPITVNKKSGKTTVDGFGMTYSDEKGYGFLDGSAVIEGRDESYTCEGIYSPNIYQDFAMPKNQTFAAKVPNGKYQVVLMAGSKDKSANTVEGILEDTVSVSLRSTQNTYVTGTYEVDVTDGRLDFKWTNANCRTNMMIIRCISSDGGSGDDSSESSETTGGSENMSGSETTGGSENTSGSETTGGSENTGGSETTGGSENTSGSETTGGSENTSGSETTGGSENTSGSETTGGSESVPKPGDAVAAVGDTQSSYTMNSDGSVQFTSTTAAVVVIPDTITDAAGKTYPVTAIASGAFAKNKAQITSVTIGNNITAIAPGQFAGFAKLKTVTIGKKVKTIGKNAFKGDKKLGKVTFKSTSKVAAIGANAFSNCTSLKTITLPNSVKTIGQSAFTGCTMLATVKMGTSAKAALQKIDKQAFKGCKKLTKITVKSTKLKTVGKNAFQSIGTKANIKVPKKQLTAYKRLIKKSGIGKKVTIT